MTKKTVIVTGAGRGLGLAITKSLLADGYYVVAISRSETAEITKLSDSNEACEFRQYDLLNTDDIADLSKSIIRDTSENNRPTIYGLVNNAAVGADGVLGTMHVTDIEKTIAINVLAPILLAKYFSRAMMMTATKGRIVNVGSIIGSTGYSGLSVYGATKAAMDGFSRSLSREVGKRGITVNTVAPGYMETEMTVGLLEKLDTIKRRSALKQFARPEDVAAMVSHIMGPMGERITGTVLTVDGGSTA